MYFLYKSVLIKILRTMVIEPCIFFSMDKYAKLGHFYSYMDLVQSFCYIGPQMGDVILYPIGCILGRAPRIKETMSDFC